MASFLTDRLTRAILSDGFTWALSTHLQVILVGQQDERYVPTPDDPYSNLDSIELVEATVAGYERATVTGPNASTSFIDHSSKALLDDVIFPALGEAGDRIAGAWVIMDRLGGWPVAFLDLQDEDDLGVELTGGDFVLHFSTGALFTIAKG